MGETSRIRLDSLIVGLNYTNRQRMTSLVNTEPTRMETRPVALLRESNRASKDCPAAEPTSLSTMTPEPTSRVEPEIDRSTAAESSAPRLFLARRELLLPAIPTA